jgi:DNA-binding NarL/FixJ family response regulator
MSSGGSGIGIGDSQQRAAMDGPPPTRKQTIRVVIADDHPIIRYALRQSLSSKGEIEVVAESVVGPEVLRIVTEIQTDVLMLGIRMSDSEVWRILQTVRQLDNAAKVIILTASEDKSRLAKALKLGCWGLILKQATAEEIANCICSVYAGRIWLDPRIVNSGGQFDTQTNNDRVAASKRGSDRLALSRREREVIALVAQGYTNPEIAAKLFISGQTVKNHLHHIYKKTGFTTRAELVIHALHT